MKSLDNIAAIFPKDLFWDVENPRLIAKYKLNHLNRISKELDVYVKDFFRKIDLIGGILFG